MRGQREPWLDEREQAAWQGFVTMHARLVSQMQRRMRRDSTLSGPDYAVLVELSDAVDGRLRAYEMCDHLRWDKSRLSRQINRMEQRGLVLRQACHTDARGSFVMVTEQGRRAVHRAEPGHVAQVRRLFVEALTADQLDALIAISRAVLAGLDRDTI
jgi:DNA-binding MarR family transcriptional regulator